MPLSDYHASVGDWRLQLRRNERKTRWVIALFLIIYTIVGLIVDTIVLEEMYPQISIEQSFLALVTLKATPYATMLMFSFAVISLLITYAMYDKIMLLGTDSHEITPENARDLREKQLYNVVEEMKVAAGLRYMPKVYLIEANYMNAFASGYSEKSAMVAITRGLMEKLDRAEMQAVMAHELSHIRHHDIKLTLMVAVLSNILLIVVDILFYSFVFGRDNSNNKRDQNQFALVIILLRYLLPLITVVLALFLSRTREYMADSGAVELMRDNEPMARALLKISEDNQLHAEQYIQEYGNTAHEQIRQSSYLFDPSSIDPVKSFNNAFSTHPAIEDRLKALGFTKKN
ncbi:zinc metalloprotease HtpX [Legionella micdadei]|uniref:Protease HtpX n=1 Tax=Legionella micdadei TaxID=451 RepID=A0A098GD35_LEGMI|nr:zinc metalloprotease HtpX [Legionella micdadei]ARG98428.1 zinc metalloprotease HtpX [Legionella micdadei]ARH01175.1 zinc metalloprotease HtpX [Legionella micdadei]KTD30364.1 heat shock protein HtpX [Legionella micdadei]NSL18360.1 zinc metalloprotease HtpX [Legionella micdadei]CEG59887.1 Heat shock protein HtpX [Legionella micdadei]